MIIFQEVSTTMYNVYEHEKNILKPRFSKAKRLY